MDTEKKRKPRVLLIATRGGVDCGIMNADGMIGTKLCLKRGLLVPGWKPKLFTTEREMKRVMAHTTTAYNTLKGTLIDEHPQLQPLLRSPLDFGHRKVVRKRGALVTHNETV